jgi:nucleotide-binding universal stress UspA family protein
MQNLVLATDFSKCSEHAYPWAVFFAQLLGARIVLMTAVSTDREAQEAQLKLAADELRALSPHVQLEAIAVKGKPAEAILQTAKTYKASLTVLGNQGKGASEKHFGSTTVQLLRSSTLPLLAIPPEAPHQPNITKVLLADDLRQVDAYGLLMLVRLIGNLEASLRILHVSKELLPEQQHLLDNLLKHAGQLLRLKGDLSHFVMPGDDPITTMYDYLSSAPVDLVAVVPRERKLLERLTSKARTPEYAIQQAVPLLALPALV